MGILISAARDVSLVAILNLWTSYELKMYSRKSVDFEVVEIAARDVEISITNVWHWRSLKIG